MSYTDLKHKLVLTRKAHQCIGCLDNFHAKTMLLHRVYIYEGDLHNEYYCSKCADALNNINADDLQDGFLPGDLVEGWSQKDRDERYKQYINDRR